MKNARDSFCRDCEISIQANMPEELSRKSERDSIISADRKRSVGTKRSYPSREALRLRHFM